jgi:REP element-mobilizing transposase RayT
MTRQFKKLAHSLYECKYHIVFCPKYRYKIMQDEVAQYVTQQIYRLRAYPKNRFVNCHSEAKPKNLRFRDGDSER